jgi:cob(I)alamin adenosyltransferase
MVQRIYTKTGDAGETGLFGGGRVSKAHPRVEAYGAVDELNAVLGWVRATLRDDDIAARLLAVQPDLFTIGAHLAAPTLPDRPRPKVPPLPEDGVARLEAWIDAAEDELPPLRSFILPGGSAGGAALHLARTVCRRAERRIVLLAAAETVDPFIVTYLNRLSDFLFVAARLENHRTGADELRWEPRAGAR